MKACLFGASVTKQRCSYVESLSRLMPGHEVVGILQTIGPYSGRVRIHKDGTFLQDRTVWDCWCHYERLAMKIPLQGPGRFTVDVSQETIDRSWFKRQIDDWGQFGPNKLVVHDIFHAGGCNVIHAE